MKDSIIQFYEKYADFAFRVAYIRTNNRADSEDLSQEVMLKIIRNQEILKELVEKNEIQARGYLAKAVINMTIEKYKKSKCRTKRESSFANKKNADTDEHEDHNDMSENKLAILNAVKELPEKYQTIIMLKFYEGHSTSELSSMLNIKEVSIRSLISRAIQKLKNSLVATGITLTAACITKDLEATELVCASAEFKGRLVQSIQENYKAPAFETGPKLNYFTLATIASIALISLYFTNNLFSKSQMTDISTTKPIQVTNTENKLYHFSFNADDFNSQQELEDAIQKSMKIASEKGPIVSFEKKGLMTVGDTPSSLTFPYTLKAEKPIVFESLVDVIHYKNKTYVSSIGLNLTIFAHKDQIPMPRSNETSYSSKFTIINKNLFYESSLYAGLSTFKISDDNFNQLLGLSFNYSILKSFSIREMSEEEVVNFKNEHQDIFNEIGAK